MTNQNINNIFDKIDLLKSSQPSSEISYNNDIQCSYKNELGCYVFYRKAGDKLLSAVYVTQAFREDASDATSLEDTVVAYLNNKVGMQVTFKSTGIDEAPLV